MAQEKLRPKPFHEVTSIWIWICRDSRQQTYIVFLRPTLYSFSGNSKAGALREECDHFVASVCRVDVLVVEIHNCLATLTLNLGGNIGFEVADTKPWRPLQKLLWTHASTFTLKILISNAIRCPQEVVKAWQVHNRCVHEARATGLWKKIVCEFISCKKVPAPRPMTLVTE
jgi:hypothetical protein